jgi:hypothetical protein
MVDVITYRTTDGTRWGGGLGSDLTAAQIDINFWVLQSAIESLQAHQGAYADIDYFVVTGSNLYVHLTNHVVLGPYTLPTAQWNPRGTWAATTAYATLDVIDEGGSVYLVTWPHTSAGSFDPNANDGSGHDYYKLLLTTPSSTVPAGGAVHQRLAKNSTADYDGVWVTDYRNLALFVQGKPSANELLLQYLCTEAMQLPASLAGSQASAGTPTTTNVAYSLAKNGAAIGSVNFPSTGGAPTFTFSAAVTFAAGDVLTLGGPAAPDTAQANISFTLQASLV